MSQVETIKIKYLPGSPHLEQTEVGDLVDLYTYKDVTLQAGESTLVSLGVCMELPEGYEANIYPRSSTFKRYGVLQTNSVAVIDETYKGDNDVWRYPIYATRPITIPKGTRLCQFRIQKHQPNLIFQEVVSLDNPDRSGFGSTGK